MFLPYYTVTGGITIPSTWDRDPFWDPFLKKKQQLKRTIFTYIYNTVMGEFHINSMDNS
jgi:hypothetical protein